MKVCMKIGAFVLMMAWFACSLFAPVYADSVDLKISNFSSLVVTLSSYTSIGEKYLQDASVSGSDQYTSPGTAVVYEVSTGDYITWRMGGRSRLGLEYRENGNFNSVLYDNWEVEDIREQDDGYLYTYMFITPGYYMAYYGEGGDVTNAGVPTFFHVTGPTIEGEAFKAEYLYEGDDQPFYAAFQIGNSEYATNDDWWWAEERSASILSIASDGEPDAMPIIYNGSAMLPISAAHRAYIPADGVWNKITWNENDKKIAIDIYNVGDFDPQYEYTIAEFWVDSTRAIYYEYNENSERYEAKEVTLSVAPVIINGTVHLPVKAIAGVTYDDNRDAMSVEWVQEKNGFVFYHIGGNTSGRSGYGRPTSVTFPDGSTIDF